MARRRRKVDVTRADLDALRALSARAISRDVLLLGGWLSMLASSDLHPHGYTVRHWLRLGEAGTSCEVLEYNPRLTDLPRVTASSYAEQREIHRALGINVVPPGQAWTDYRQKGLFDDIFQGAKEVTNGGEQKSLAPDH